MESFGLLEEKYSQKEGHPLILCYKLGPKHSLYTFLSQRHYRARTFNPGCLIMFEPCTCLALQHYNQGQPSHGARKFFKVECTVICTKSLLTNIKRLNLKRATAIKNIFRNGLLYKNYDINLFRQFIQNFFILFN